MGEEEGVSQITIKDEVNFWTTPKSIILKIH